MKYLILSLCLLTGCATTNTKEMQEVISDKKNQKTYIFPDDKILESCKELPLPSGKKFSDTYNDLITYSKIYYQCSADKDELAEWIKNFKYEITK